MRITEHDIRQSIKKVLAENLPNFGIDDRLELVNDPNTLDADGNPKRGNFALRRFNKNNPEDFEEYWVSRSNIVSLLVYCKAPDGRWCTLANQRGSGKWNYVHGYLDYGETLEDAAVRECFEETGVKISKNQLRFNGTDSSKLYGNVSTRYSVVLPGTTENYPTTNTNAEPGEVLAVAWIPLNEINKYKWVAPQNKTIINVFKTLYGNNNGRYTELKTVLGKMIQSRDISPEQYKEIRKILGF